MFHESIRRRIFVLGLNKGVLAELVGVSAPAMSNFLKGRKQLKDLKQLGTVLTELESLKKCFPIPLGMQDPKLLALALERFREGKFTKFIELTQSTNWRPSREDVKSLRRHYPKLWKAKK
jgi:hypothetical protein